MAVRFTRDDSNQRVTLVGSGPFVAEEVVEILDRMKTDGSWTFAVLFDMRAVVGAPSLVELRRVAEAASDPAIGARGPLAIVVTSPTLYGMACAYAAMSKTRSIEVFRDPREADDWLKRNP